MCVTPAFLHLCVGLCLAQVTSDMKHKEEKEEHTAGALGSDRSWKERWGSQRLGSQGGPQEVRLGGTQQGPNRERSRMRGQDLEDEGAMAWVKRSKKMVARLRTHCLGGRRDFRGQGRIGECNR